jgi:ATP-dependent Clp protease ATP-binding subunit ClpX
VSVRTCVRFTLKEYLKLSDLFVYGMMPQFISRFSSVAIFENLRKEDLK